jgi:hypothetical protein
MASDRPDLAALDHSLEITSPPLDSGPRLHPCSIEMLRKEAEGFEGEEFESGEPPSHDHCDDKTDSTDPSTSIASTKRFAGQTVAPFLARHIPEQYAPLGVIQKPPTSRKDPNTKYCYRHRPDSKCRRTADEPTMENLQRVRDFVAAGSLSRPVLTSELRTSRPCHRLTSKASPTSGRSSPPPLLSTAI